MLPAIEIQHVSKQYVLGERRDSYGSLRETIAQAMARPFQALRKSSANGRRRHANNSFWALKDVSLTVEAGDRLAIIGANGAGKSTLLKILSRITDPTEGTIRVRGRLASLLEVGTGFHPELTGRENIYLNGSILGMHKAEIEAKFDEIVAFSGIGKFLDTPVKRYSSGMYVRLAFAVAAHLEPDILVVDEVLAVGDTAFQKKCLGKMAEACKQARTVIFVSHNLAAVEALCNKAVVLQRGSLVFTGSATDAIQFYQENLPGEGIGKTSHIVDLRHAPRKLSQHRATLQRVEFYADGKPFLGELPLGASLRVVIHFILHEPCTRFEAVVGIDTPFGQRVCTAASAYEPSRVYAERTGEQVFICDIPDVPLVPGEYRIGIGLEIAHEEVDWVGDVMRLHVLRSDYYGTGTTPHRGTFLLQNHWTLADAPSALLQEPARSHSR